MNLPITNYEITLRDIVDSLIGIIVIIFGVIGCVIFTNIIMNLFLSNTKTMNDITTIIFVLFINIVIILLFVMLVRHVSKELIKNTLILNSLFSFIGPTIASSSLFFTPNIKALVELTK